MSILTESVSPRLDLRMQGIETSGATTFRDVLIALLDNRTRNPGNPDGAKWADRQSPSVALPLRSAIAQQIGLSSEEAARIRQESIDSLTEYKQAQARKENKDPMEVVLTSKEIEDWMSVRISVVLQRKIEKATVELVGDRALIGFRGEEELEEHIRAMIFQDTESEFARMQETEMV